MINVLCMVGMFVEDEVEIMFVYLFDDFWFDCDDVLVGLVVVILVVLVLLVGKYEGMML